MGLKFKDIYLIVLGVFLFTLFIIYQLLPVLIKDDFFSVFLLILLVVILFFPLVSEIQIFDFIKIKKELDDFKKDIDTKLSILQTTMVSSVNNNSQIVLFGYGKPDKREIKRSEQIIDKEIEKISSEKKESIESKVHNIYENVDDVTNDLFKVRFLIEQKVNNLLNFMNVRTDNMRPLSASLKLLENSGTYNKNLTNLIKEIVYICNKAVHGRKISPNDYDYVMTISKKVLFMLEETRQDAKREYEKFKTN